ncbi:helix-turn-helix domain-containing protein [Sediminibacterium sp.]|uniref:helix-turn-helix domain-containing protein n=1 Tax=Sediminibacterium sp. TaxID=1917865 RepID=UPI003F699C29
MITNDRQYKITKSQIETFEESLAALSMTPIANENIDPRLLELHRNAIEVQLHELLNQTKEYEDLKAGNIVVSEVHTLADLPLALIKSRIANGLTQSQLADTLGLKMQQIQRYESEKYETASLKTLIKIAESLGIKINADIQIKTIEAPDNLDIKNYPFKQMFQRKWFNNFSGSFNDAIIDSKNLLESLFERAGLSSFQYSLTKKSIRSNSSLNTFALNAWYAQVVIKAKEQFMISTFDKEVITERWINTLAHLSCETDGPVKAVDFLKNSGIRFVIEPQLEGTFLDGAALLLDNKEPIIAMTLRHDRLDNFWFVLFHEIAHIHLHLSDSLTVIFDDLDVKIDGIEHEADEFSLNALIPNSVWKKSLVRFNPSKEAIINQAKTLKIHPALIAGRIRRESGRYYQFSDLIGQGEVRKHFSLDF